MENLRDIMIEYRGYTEELKTALEAENYDLLEGLLTKRQKLMDVIKERNFEPRLLKASIDELGVADIEASVDKLMREKLDAVKSELRKVTASKSINKNYNQNNYVDSIFFSKKA